MRELNNIEMATVSGGCNCSAQTPWSSTDKFMMLAGEVAVLGIATLGKSVLGISTSSALLYSGGLQAVIMGYMVYSAKLLVEK